MFTIPVNFNLSSVTETSQKSTELFFPSSHRFFQCYMGSFNCLKMYIIHRYVQKALERIKLHVCVLYIIMKRKCAILYELLNYKKHSENMFSINLRWWSKWATVSAGLINYDRLWLWGNNIKKLTWKMFYCFSSGTFDTVLHLIIFFSDTFLSLKYKNFT